MLVPVPEQRLVAGDGELLSLAQVQEVTLLRRPKEQAAWLQLVEEQPKRLQAAPEAMREDAEVVKRAVEQRGDVLQWAAKELRGDAKLVLLAMQWSPEAGQ